MLESGKAREVYRCGGGQRVGRLAKAYVIDGFVDVDEEACEHSIPPS